MKTSTRMRLFVVSTFLVVICLAGVDGTAGNNNDKEIQNFGQRDNRNLGRDYSRSRSSMMGKKGKPMSMKMGPKNKKMAWKRKKMTYMDKSSTHFSRKGGSMMNSKVMYIRPGFRNRPVFHMSWKGKGKGKGFNRPRSRPTPRRPHPRPRPRPPGAPPQFPTTTPPTSMPTLPSVCDDTEPNSFSEDLFFEFEGPIGLVAEDDIALLETVLLDAYNTVAMCDAPGAYIRAEDVSISIDEADSFGDNIDTDDSTIVRYTWLVTFSGSCRGCPDDVDLSLFGPGDSGDPSECVCDFPTTEAYILECNESLQNIGTTGYSLTLLGSTALVGGGSGGNGTITTGFTSSITVSGEGGLFGGGTLDPDLVALWQTSFLESYNSISFWNTLVCDPENRIIESVEYDSIVTDPENPELFSIVFNIEGTCQGCPSETIIFGAHDASTVETGQSCPEGALIRCPTSDEFRDALQEVIDSENPGGANISDVTIPISQQDQFITCVAVIDETAGFPPRSELDRLWQQLRTEFPFRPFCLLQPLRSDAFRVYTPPTLLADPSTIFENVTRDEGVVSSRSDWYDICNVDASLSTGLTRVGLFIDNSGSMRTSTVRASYDFFLQRLEENGISDVAGVQNSNQDYISPCLTTTVIPP